jgi:hypothetical protein
MRRIIHLARCLGFTLQAAIAAAAAPAALAQTSPAHGPITAEADMPMADFLALLQQIAPAAAQGTRIYLGAYQLMCGRTLSTLELRHAIAQEGGDPILMGLIEAAQRQDNAARDRFVRTIQCAATPGQTQ